MTAIQHARRLSFAGLAGWLTALACALSPMAAQAQQLPPVPQVHQTIDGNGVDLTSGKQYLSFPLVSVGPQGPGGLSFALNYQNAIWTPNIVGQVQTTGTGATVAINSSSVTFTLSGGTYTSDQGDGSSLSYNSATQQYTYALSSDVAYTINNYTSETIIANNEIAKITYPTGEVLTFNYVMQTDTSCTPSCTDYRLQSITSSLGYQIQLFYSYNGPISSIAEQNAYYALTSVTGFNLAYDYCNPMATSCSFNSTYHWPTATITLEPCYSPSTITDPDGNTTTFTYYNGGCGSGITTIKRPSGMTLTYGLNPIGYPQVTSVSNNLSATWGYAYVTNSGNLTTTVTDPLGDTTTVVSSATTNLVSSYADGLDRTTMYAYDSYGRLTTVTLPSGASTEIGYDAMNTTVRGDITSITQVSKTPGTPANIVVSATYDPGCSHPSWCNQPETVTARGQTTSYSYNNTTGQVATVTQPSVNGVAPQTGYSYTSMTAWYSDGGASYVQGAAVSKLTGTTACQTMSSCAGTSDQQVTTTSYQSGSASTASNVLPNSVTVASGAKTTLATTGMGYDYVSDVASVVGPLGSAQTSTFYYDQNRNLVAAVGPDPDGSGGSLLNRALLTTYTNGLVTEVQQGTESGNNDPRIGGFTSLQQVTSSYDVLDRKSQDTTTAGGTTYAVTQYGYDLANRLQCTAARMNPSAFSSPPSSACALGTTGSYGPDRITYTSYDAANEVVKTTTGYATANQRDVQTLAYSPDGLVKSLTDGDGNVSLYKYDGLDRVCQIQYAHAATGDCTNTGGDYQAYAYNTVGDLQTVRQRNGQSIAFTFDALDRLSTKSPPDDAEVTYGYDNFGDLTSVAGSRNTSYAYDLLGRMTQQTQGIYSANVSMVSVYNPDGTRKQLTWPDGFYVSYDYDNVGEMTDVKESGSTVLAAFTYDNLGNRTGVTRYDNVTTSYGYDGVSDLTSLGYTGSSNGQGYGYGYNPAGQMVSKYAANPAYAYGNSPQNTAYGVASLNQYASVGGTAYGYDGNANLTSGPPQSYTFDSQNRLIGSSGGASPDYLPTDQLFQATSSGVQFLYDGDQIVAEYQSGVLQDRYVDGPDEDEPMVWYQGSGDANRQWLLNDERGSVIAGADGSGTIQFIDSYDEYGQPGSSNQGRFQYTGQAWIPEAGLYDYKARMYLPSIGRFLQTDPAGFAAGMNLYAYVGNDPINMIDPTGRMCIQLSYLEADYLCQWIGETGTVGGTSEGGSPPPEPPIPPPYIPKKLPQPKSQSSPACTAAQQRLSELGQEIESFGGALQWASLGLGGLGLLTSEGGVGEVLIPGAIWAGRIGGATSALGAAVQGYARGGPVPALTNGLFSVAQSFATNGLTSAALEGLLGKQSYQLAENAMGQLSGALINFKQTCGTGGI